MDGLAPNEKINKYDYLPLGTILCKYLYMYVCVPVHKYFIYFSYVCIFEHTNGFMYEVIFICLYLNRVLNTIPLDNSYLICTKIISHLKKKLFKNLN